MSIQYNTIIDEFNKINEDNQLLRFDFGNIDENNTDISSLNKEKVRLFNKFKFIFIKSISQFSKGLICRFRFKNIIYIYNELL